MNIFSDNALTRISDLTKYVLTVFRVIILENNRERSHFKMIGAKAYFYFTNFIVH